MQLSPDMAAVVTLVDGFPVCGEMSLLDDVTSDERPKLCFPSKWMRWYSKAAACCFANVSLSVIISDDNLTTDFEESFHRIYTLN